jgi:hypothetical protein
VWGEWKREGVEPRAAQGAVMSGGAKGTLYRPAWRAEASGGKRSVVEFNSTGLKLLKGGGESIGC